jgi:hypothetical protein
MTCVLRTTAEEHQVPVQVLPVEETTTTAAEKKNNKKTTTTKN